jgi:hypothetical protein
MYSRFAGRWRVAASVLPASSAVHGSRAAAGAVPAARPVSARRKTTIRSARVGTVEAAQRGLNGAALFPHRRAGVRQRALFPEPDRDERLLSRHRDQARRRGRRRLARARLSAADAAAERHAADRPLPAGEEVTLSDAILVFRHEAPPTSANPRGSFLQMLGVAYKLIDLPRTEYRDWIAAPSGRCAISTRRPRRRSAIMAIAMSIPIPGPNIPTSWSRCRSSRRSMTGANGAASRTRSKPKFKAGLGKFYDPKLKTLRRYLPNVGDDKDPTRSTAGISTTRCSTWASRARRRRRGARGCSSSRSTSGSRPRTISTINGRSSTRSPTSR